MTIEKHLFHSKNVNDLFEIKVKLPKGYGSKKTRYPVVYLMDANIFWGLVSDTLHLLQYGQEVPEVILVGVGYPNDADHMVLRDRDYLPTYNLVSENSGNANEFLNFLQEELMNFVNSRYRTISEDSTLIGDSYSGLFALYTLFTEPDTFRRYVIGSPSIYWDNRVILKLEEDYSKMHKALEARVFISVGELEAVYEPIFAQMVANVKELVATLYQREYVGLRLASHIFECETHLSVIPATFSRGLREVFRLDNR